MTISANEVVPVSPSKRAMYITFAIYWSCNQHKGTKHSVWGADNSKNKPLMGISHIDYKNLEEF